MRLLYLTRGLTTMSGRSAFVGRTLFDRLSEIADDAVPTHIVFPMGMRDPDPQLLDDVLTARSYLRYDPHVIYFEGGLMGHDDWRVPRLLLERSVRIGAIAVVADVDELTAQEERERYRAKEALKFLGAQLRYGSDDREPLVAVDKKTGRKRLVYRPEQITTSDWLRPAYDGVEKILISSPVQLVAGSQGILAACDQTTTATLYMDEFVDQFAYSPLASVSKFGDGYVVLIAGLVSHDRLLAEAPDNATWIINTINLLRAESARDVGRYKSIRRLQQAFHEIKTTAPNPDDPVNSATLARVLDREQEVMLRRQIAADARGQLGDLFGTSWDRLTPAAQQRLAAAEVHRRDSELMADTEEAQDFSAAVGAYSRAVETEVLCRLFEQHRDRDDAGDLPEPPAGEGSKTRSLAALKRYVTGGNALTMGEMGWVLLNVGYKLRDAEPNSFAAHLRQRLVDYDAFYRDKFPRRLLDYADKYRNAAMHVGDVSAEDCKAARDHLFEEPVRLLLYLTEAVHGH
jgi:hypothetical protein